MEYYRKNPPELVLDDEGVRHIQEIEDVAEYQNEPCECGIVHQVEDDTWYHKAFNLTKGGEAAVYRACKECREILTKKLVRKEV